MRDAASTDASPIGRCELKPALDWVQIQVVLQSPSQPRHLRERMPAHWGNVYVHPVEGQQSSRIFNFRVPDPSGPDALMADLQALALPNQGSLLEEQVRVVGVEVALDAKPVEDDPELLVDAAFHLVWHLAHPPAGQLLVTEPSHFRADARQRSLRQALHEGWSLNNAPGGRKREITLGPADHHDGLRAYVKRYDSSPSGPYQPLHPRAHRARLERTLLGTASPFSTIAAWRTFKFQSLAPLFAMCRTDPNASDFMKMLHGAGGPLGRPVDAARRAAHRRMRRAGTRRDTLLNEQIRVSLRKLTRSQRAGIRTLGEIDGRLPQRERDQAGTAS